jgi:hypothetical protein
MGALLAAIILVLSGPHGAPAAELGDQLHVTYDYAGVSCPQSNSVACDRVGIFVSTADKPDYVVATIAGHSILLTDPGWHRDGAASFEGFLQAPGLLHEGPLAVDATRTERWFGSPQVSAPMVLIAVYGDGSYARAFLPAVNLAAGYG